MKPLYILLIGIFIGIFIVSSLSQVWVDMQEKKKHPGREEIKVDWLFCLYMALGTTFFANMLLYNWINF